MANTVVDIVVKVVGGQKLQQLDKSLKGTAAAAVKADNKLDGFSAASRKAGNSAAASKKGVQSLSAGFSKLAVAIGAADIARRAFVTALNATGTNSRLGALTGQYGEYEQALARVQSIQAKYNLTQSEATAQFSTAYARLKPLGFSLNEIQDAYEGITTATKTAALDAGAANALFTQTAQALGSGVVQAEELNTIIDQAPMIVVALADELGVAAGQVKKLASDGKVSSDALLKALIKVKTEGADQVAEALKTPAERIKQSQVVAEQVITRLLNGVIADLADGIGDISEAIKDLYPVFEGLGVVAQSVMRPIIALFRAGAEVAAGFGRAVKNASEGNWDKLLKPDTEGLDNLKEIFDDLMAPLDANIPKPLEGNRTSSRTPYSPNGGKSGGSKAAAAVRESQAPALQRELELAQKLEGVQSKINAAELAGDKQLQIRLEGQAAMFELMKQEGDIKAENIPTDEKQLKLLKLGVDVRLQALDTQQQLTLLAKEEAEAISDVMRPLEQQRELLEAKLKGNEKEVRLRQQAEDLARNITGLDAADVLPILQKNAALQEQVKQAEALKASYAELAGGIAGEFTSAFKSVIDGTKSVEDAFAGMLKGIADKFLDMAAKIIQDALTKQLINLFSSLFGPSAGFNGVPGGRGPEFMGPAFAGGGYTGDGPRSGGVDGKGGFPAILHPQETVVDHYDDARNAMSTSAANSTAFAEAESAMAMASSNYVMNTTTITGTGTSDGPGGSSGPIQIQTNVINKVEYATVEEVNKGMQMSAKQAEANVFRNMRNKPATRNRVGV